MKKAQMQLEDLTCPSCIAKIEGALKNTDGVSRDSINIMFNSSKVKLEYDSEKISEDRIIKIITDLGYEVKNIKTR